MIKDAEDKGLITPGKVSKEDSPCLEIIILVDYAGFSIHYHHSCITFAKYTPCVQYIITSDG